AGGDAGCAGLAGGLRDAFLAAAAFLAEAAFLAVLRAAVFLAVALRAGALRAAVLRVAALRAPARFFALDFAFFLPSVAPARRMAAVAARFIFFKAAAAPELLFRLLDLAMIGPPSLPRLALWAKRAYNKTHRSPEGKSYTAILCAFCTGGAWRTSRSASGLGPPVAQSTSSTRWTTGMFVAWPIWSMQARLLEATTSGATRSILAALRRASPPAKGGWGVLEVPGAPQHSWPSATFLPAEPRFFPMGFVSAPSPRPFSCAYRAI